jgi:glycine/D-amino acid oxidase-like deaminating enzyme
VRTDIAIVGAGITGLSVAWHVLERGRDSVAVYERAGVGAGASGVQPGGVRQQWGTRLNVAMARASLAFYRELGAHLEPRIDPGFRACGYLFAASLPETLERLRADVALQNELGVSSAILSPAEAAEVVPGLRGEAIVGASFCPEDGFFDRPQGVVEAFAEAVRRKKVPIERAAVNALERAGARWRLRLADGAAAEAEQVVVATGVDAPALLEPLGVELPIAPEPRYLFLGDPIRERLLEPLVVAPDRHLAAKQLADGRLLASDLSAAGDPEQGRDRWRRRVRDGLAELLPRLELVSLPQLVGGAYDMTPDRQAIVGRIPGRPGLLVAAGFSGHGFMMAPEIGRGLAALLAGEDPGPELAQLAPERFEGGSLTPEPEIV